MKRIKDVVYAGIVKCLDSVTAPKFIGNLQGTADKAKGIVGLTTSVTELNHVKGVTNGVQTQIDNLTKAINDATALRASLEAYGMTKVTNSSAVTDSTGLALAATEKNASIDGTLANQISQLNSDNSKKIIVDGDGYIVYKCGHIYEMYLSGYTGGTGKLVPTEHIPSIESIFKTYRGVGIDNSNGNIITIYIDLNKDICFYDININNFTNNPIYGYISWVN